jgi:hypothetical protein
VVDLLRQTEEEERAADSALTQVAESLYHEIEQRGLQHAAAPGTAVHKAGY